MGRRAIILVLDSVGIGAMPDAGQYGDEGSNTLANIADRRGGLNLPNLSQLGLGNIYPITGVGPVKQPKACFGKMAEQSPGKDTMTGHWEMAGVILTQAFQVFPDGFPQEFIEKYSRAIGRNTLGNEVASGTEIIQRLGEEHVRTGKPIVYTSADSVFQIAAHEEVIPLEELMRFCRIAREMLRGDMLVGRVIARPFLGQPGNFYRTANRHDFAIEPPRKILFEYLRDQGLVVQAVGKIHDIYVGRGISEYVTSKSNAETFAKTVDYLKQNKSGLIMSNFVDFDMLYGHRNDVEGYARALEEFDAWLPQMIEELQPEDILLITADHGCDPTTASTDHSREYVPLLVYGKQLQQGVNLGIRSSFADLGATVAEYLAAEPPAHGESFYHWIRGDGKND